MKIAKNVASWTLAAAMALCVVMTAPVFDGHQTEAQEIQPMDIYGEDIPRDN